MAVSGGTRTGGSAGVTGERTHGGRRGAATRHGPGAPRPAVSSPEQRRAVSTGLAPPVLADVVVDAARRIHSVLGPGLLEHVYEVVLGHELIRNGVPVERQRLFPVRYGRIVVEKGFRADLVVDDRLLVEVKSASRLVTVHRQQVTSYCRMAGFELGLLVNFGGESMEGAVQRVEVGPRPDPLALLEPGPLPSLAAIDGAAARRTGRPAEDRGDG